MSHKINSIDTDKILETIIAFSTETDYFKLLDIVLAKMRKITNCEAGTLYVLRDNKLHFTIVQNDRLGISTYEEGSDIPPVDLGAKAIENVCAYCAIHNEMVNIDDVYDSNEFNFSGPRKYDEMTGFKTRSMLVFPISNLQGQVIGVIQLLNALDDAGNVIPFDLDKKQTIWSLSNTAAITLMNVRYVADINELLQSFVKIMTAAIDERTQYNADHTITVAENTQKFVRYLRSRFEPNSLYHLDENRENQLVMAAYMHDIGKIGMPNEIMDKAARLGGSLPLIVLRIEIKKLHERISHLSGQTSEDEYNRQIASLDSTLAFVNRVNTTSFLTDKDLKQVQALKRITYTDENGSTVPVFSNQDIECLSIRSGTLTDSEREVMQEHSLITERLLNNIKFSKQYENVTFWAKSHHELLDGSGYPHQLSGSQIPIEVRILTVMDIYSALTANRPYRKMLPHDVAANILFSMAGTGKLDEELVRLFIDSISESYGKDSMGL